MVDSVWVLAAFNVGLLFGGIATLGGMLAFRRYARPVPRPYLNPVVTDITQDIADNAAEAAAAPIFKLSEAELQSFASDIMRETGVDEETAREEVTTLLTQAGELGQG
jgi:hypothetical protein